MIYYGSLCTQIYDLDKPKAPEKELQYYLQFAPNKDMKILEPMCGTGRFLIPFLEKGYKVDGFDGSEDMLNACRKKVKQKNLRSNLTYSRADEFVTNEKYDLIMTPGGSFVCIKEKQELINSLKRLYDCLKDEGKLMIEVLTPQNSILETEHISEWEETNRKTREDGKVIVQYSKTSYDQENELITYPLKYELLDGENIMEIEEMILYIKLYKIDEFKAHLEEAGFKVLNIFNGYSNETAIAKSELVIFECSK